MLRVYHSCGCRQPLYTRGMHVLGQYGWNDKRVLGQSVGVAARVVADYGRHYAVVTPERRTARIRGTLEHDLTPNAMPKIGDFVDVELQPDGAAIITNVLPRSSEIVRGQVGRLVDKQVVAANVDVAFVVQPLDHDFSVERLERYIFQLSSQAIVPIILLNKTDKVDDLAERKSQLQNLGVQILAISALHDTDVAAVRDCIGDGRTAVILGSSGAGKSTLTNRLLGSEQQATAPIRERDSKGRHTTVHRELFLLPGGGMIIDTPGIRELQLWGGIGELDNVFADVATAAAGCRFGNCTHESEDGCAVQAAIQSGTLARGRYNTYANFKKELVGLAARRDFIQERRSARAKNATNRRRHRAQQRLRSDDAEKV